MAQREDDDIDLERATMDPDYRRKVLRRLRAEAEGRDGGGSAENDTAQYFGSSDARRRGPTVKPPRR